MLLCHVCSVTVTNKDTNKLVYSTLPFRVSFIIFVAANALSGGMSNLLGLYFWYYCDRDKPWYWQMLYAHGSAMSGIFQPIAIFITVFTVKGTR